MTDLRDPDAFVALLRAEGARLYHDKHPFNLRMHAGTLSRAEIQRWVQNRFYYQTRIPIKDALILSKSEDPAFRRMWIHRIVDHDGTRDDQGSQPGGIEQWLRLAEGVGLDRSQVISLAGVLPAVRFACDAYVDLVRSRSLVEAVASSLTETFAPDLMSTRIAAWKDHYRWVDPACLAYFETRVPRSRRDGGEALDFVVRTATTRELQDRCVDALVTKCHILWALLDAVEDRAQDRDDDA